MPNPYSGDTTTTGARAGNATYNNLSTEATDETNAIADVPGLVGGGVITKISDTARNLVEQRLRKILSLHRLQQYLIIKTYNKLNLIISRQLLLLLMTTLREHMLMLSMQRKQK